MKDKVRDRLVYLQVI